MSGYGCENLDMEGKMIAHSDEEIDALMEKIQQAQITYSTYTQEQVDKIFQHVAFAALTQRVSLAQMAATETGMGVIEQKVIKNNFAAEMIHNKYKNERTCDVIEEDAEGGITKVAEPIGVIAAILPCTNPTSTAIYKALLALKTRNAIVFSPHPRAKGCSCAATKLLHDAAVEAGAPEYILGCVGSPTLERTTNVIRHAKTDMIMATGGPGLIAASYSSGKPAVTGGSGNSPVVIEETADIPMAVNSICMSKTFDNGLICASEQAVVVMDSVYEETRAEFVRRGCHFMSADELEMMNKTLFKDGRMNAKMVGQTAWFNAKEAGFAVPINTTILIGELDHAGEDVPLSHEKLCPVLGMYRGRNYEDACDIALTVIKMGGLGHTSCLYVGTQNQDRCLQKFQNMIPAGRVLVNTPTTFGAIGDMYNQRTLPGLTIACGSWGGNATSDIVSCRELLNVKTVSHKRENMQWFQVPRHIFFKSGILKEALQDSLKGKRAFIVTDSIIMKLGFLNKLTSNLKAMGVEYDVFSDVAGEPTQEMVAKCVKAMTPFEPDTLIAIGGGSPVDMCKMARLQYEHPDFKIEAAAARFMDIRKKVAMLPAPGKSVRQMIMIPTTSGTGAEVTPFAVISCSVGGVERKYAIADYSLTPDVAIIDASFTTEMPRGLTANTGIDALTHALEAHVSVMSTEFTQGMSSKAAQLLFEYLPKVYETPSCLEYREKVHNASTMAGMAFANAFLGINHSLAHTVGSMFHIPHGLANGILLPHVIKYNSATAPLKVTPFAQYKHSKGMKQYAELARDCNLTKEGQNDEEMCDALIDGVRGLMKKVNMPLTFKELGIDEEQFTSPIQLQRMGFLSFDDQCTGCNPRFPMIAELQEILLRAYYGNEEYEEKYKYTVYIE